MKTSILTLSAYLVILCTQIVLAETDVRKADFFSRSEDHRAMIPMRVIREVAIPRGYHEGLLVEESTVWVNNGKGGKTWIVDPETETVISKITPVGTFSEGLTAADGGRYWMTDWDLKKLFLVKIEKDTMVPESEISTAPSHPAGIIWTGSDLYVITWTRGLGTKYHLLKMDRAGNLVLKVRIKGIPEPSQITWDGQDLWISSWFNRRIYRIDSKTYQIKGYFRSHIERTSGIAWDGKYFWITGTEANLFQIEVLL